MRIKELQAMAPAEREAKMTELSSELMKLRSQASTGTAQKGSGRIRAAKRMIAKILTLNRQGGKSKE